jgi:hypothetical protein
MKRRILLVEPNYRNKYPPIGLMKISTYHKQLGDQVTFYKGDLKGLVLRLLMEDCITKLKRIDNSVVWSSKSAEISQYLRLKKSSALSLIGIPRTAKTPKIEKCLSRYADIFRKKEFEQKPLFDRVYVTTLFTFYWKVTIETIQYAKKLVKRPEDVMVGGVMASLLTKEIEAETGLRPMTGLLDRGGMLDGSKKAKNIIIDDLPLDYSILDEIDYEYPTQSAYFTFMTKGCTRKCAFCSVPKLEPTYKPKIETVSKFNEITKRFGEQQNLLLMDNNVLASPNFPEIIQEIKEMGFAKGATYVEPNQLDIAIKNLKGGYNDKAYIRRSYKLIHSLASRIRGKSRNEYDNILKRYELHDFFLVSKRNLIRAYKHLSPFYEKYRSKLPRQRFVDFNQGTDARYVTDELMKLMSEIPIRPLRIAFDYIGLKDKYVNAVELAAKHGINELSNYILYNFVDTPEDLYNRLLINVELVERLRIYIYSFPMKYIPLYGEEAKDRAYIGKKWNKKFIRAVQCILNVTKGIVAPGREFFEVAFGKDLNEFYHLLYMPETYIVYRKTFGEKYKLTQIWREQFDALMNSDDAELVRQIIVQNDFRNYRNETGNPRIDQLLEHYSISRNEVTNIDTSYKKLKTKFLKFVKKNQHHNLTLTYDFEAATARKKHKAPTKEAKEKLKLSEV